MLFRSDDEEVTIEKFGSIKAEDPDDYSDYFQILDEEGGGLEYNREIKLTRKIRVDRSFVMPER